LQSHKYVILTTTALSVLAAILFLYLSTPQYTAAARILIEMREAWSVEYTPTPDNVFSDAMMAELENQIRALKSESVLRHVIASERLDSDPEFSQSGTSLMRWAFSGVLEPFGIAHGLGRTDPTVAALHALGRRIGVKRARQGSRQDYGVDLTVTTQDPGKSVRIVNALTQAYLEEQKSAAAEAARRPSDLVSTRLLELKERRPRGRGKAGAI
jgi:succinoglycan biosynthesis transport protein ExoP